MTLWRKKRSNGEGGFIFNLDTPYEIRQLASNKTEYVMYGRT